jgi:hypothetical protein
MRTEQRRIAMNQIDLKSTAEEAAGNHLKFKDYMSRAWDWLEDWEEGGANWTVWYTSNRDSTLMDQSNEEAIKKMMQPFIDDGSAQLIRDSHWAVGYVDGYAVRVYDKMGDITPAFQQVAEIKESLSSYPVLDEEDYLQKEYDATIENIKEVMRSVRADDDDDVIKPFNSDAVAKELFSYFWDGDQRQVESVDDTGGYPDEDAVEEALKVLGYLKQFTPEGEEIEPPYKPHPKQARLFNPCKSKRGRR